jgi:hypothetical protein
LQVSAFNPRINCSNINDKKFKNQQSLKADAGAGDRNIKPDKKDLLALAGLNSFKVSAQGRRLIIQNQKID